MVSVRSMCNVSQPEVLISSSSLAGLTALSKEVREKYGTKVEVVTADLTDSVDLASLEKLTAADKRVTMLVNNGGNAKLAP
jgi:uncharacterized protein